ncbi:MAG TPA: hypothetical protein PLT28_06920, partial [Saprospiraceae bacterium]|nr:hypothetical protein [Saprospiraceae bacterium]
ITANIYHHLYFNFVCSGPAILDTSFWTIKQEHSTYGIYFYNVQMGKELLPVTLSRIHKSPSKIFQTKSHSQPGF